MMCLGVGGVIEVVCKMFTSKRKNNTFQRWFRAILYPLHPLFVYCQ